MPRRSSETPRAWQDKSPTAVPGKLAVQRSSVIAFKMHSLQHSLPHMPHGWESVGFSRAMKRVHTRFRGMHMRRWIGSYLATGQRSSPSVGISERTRITARDRIPTSLRSTVCPLNPSSSQPQEPITRPSRALLKERQLQQACPRCKTSSRTLPRVDTVSNLPDIAFSNTNIRRTRPRQPPVSKLYPGWCRVNG